MRLMDGAATADAHRCCTRRRWTHVVAIGVHLALCFVGWASGRAPGLARIDDAVRETCIGTVLLLLFLSCAAHASVVGAVAVGVTLAKHVFWVLLHVDLGLTPTMILYGTSVLPMVGAYHGCPYILAAGTYSFVTKVLDRSAADVRLWLQGSGAPCCATRADWELAKLVISALVFVLAALLLVIARRGALGPLVFSPGCGTETAHLSPRRRRLN